MVRVDECWIWAKPVVRIPHLRGEIWGTRREREYDYPRERLSVSLANLDEAEREVVRECLRATVEGPFFPDWEFSTIFGLERDEVRRVLLSWPTLDEADESVVRAISNSLN